MRVGGECVLWNKDNVIQKVALNGVWDPFGARLNSERVDSLVENLSPVSDNQTCYVFEEVHTSNRSEWPKTPCIGPVAA